MGCRSPAAGVSAGRPLQAGSWQAGRQSRSLPPSFLYGLDTPQRWRTRRLQTSSSSSLLALSSLTTRQTIPGVSSSRRARHAGLLQAGRSLSDARIAHSSADDQTAHHGEGGDEEEEYAALLTYIAKSSEKKSTQQKAGVNSDGSYEKKHRLWYAPWKTKTVKYDKNGEVIKGDSAMQTPEDWCVFLVYRIAAHDRRSEQSFFRPPFPIYRLETEVGQGLTDAQVEERRKVVGWNELESCVVSPFLYRVEAWWSPPLCLISSSSTPAQKPTALALLWQMRDSR